MKRILEFIDRAFGYLVAERFLCMFAAGWTSFIRNVNANTLLLRGESVLGMTHIKKKRGKALVFRYKRKPNGQIVKVAA